MTIGATLARMDGDRHFCDHFDGKIEAPTISQECIPFDQNVKLESLYRTCIARWDFSIGIDSPRIEDVSGRGRHGDASTLPTRAVTGHNWRGQTLRWLDRPDLYGAIHFHCDDLQRHAMGDGL